MQAAEFAPADSYWAATLGCLPEQLCQPGVRVVESPDPTYRGALLFRRGPASVLSVPAGLVGAVSNAVGRLDPAALLDRGNASDLFGEPVERVIGPAYVGLAASLSFLPDEPGGARLLDAADEPALRRLE